MLTCPPFESRTINNHFKVIKIARLFFILNIFLLVQFIMMRASLPSFSSLVKSYLTHAIRLESYLTHAIRLESYLTHAIRLECENCILSLRENSAVRDSVETISACSQTALNYSLYSLRLDSDWIRICNNNHKKTSKDDVN